MLFRSGVAVIVAINADAGHCHCCGGVSSDDAGNGGHRLLETMGGVVIVVVE